MQHQKLFITALMIGSIASHNCYAAEPKIVTSNTSPKPILLDKGLLTLVPSLLGKGSLFKNYFFMRDVKRGEPNTLANLMGSHQYSLESKHDGCDYLFCPTIVRIEGNILKNLGSFSNFIHEEVKEACRLKQAVFYPHKQGAIIYSLDSNFNIHFFESKEKELEQMIDENAKGEIVLRLPIFERLGRN